MTRAQWVFLFTALVLAGTPAAFAQQQTAAIQVTLFHGQNDVITDDLNKSPKLKKKLIRLFGYSRYHEIGSAMGSLEKKDPQYLKPSKQFFLCISRCQSEKHLYGYEIYHENKAMFKGEFLPKAGIPLIIKGPNYDHGVLILVLENEMKKSQ